MSKYSRLPVGSTGLHSAACDVPDHCSTGIRRTCCLYQGLGEDSKVGVRGLCVIQQGSLTVQCWAVLPTSAHKRWGDRQHECAAA
jgi:hypothetical protein